ncbi:MAG: hypothetical protein DRI46_08390 [Chloroflexi bacterium]|nr:MAG: hypothetical protein DRI46_08390 [Chloroflexota bacterium]
MTDYGEDIEQWTAAVMVLCRELEKLDRINDPVTSNPALSIVKMVAARAVPLYKAVSPVDTGLLRDSHIVGGSGISDSQSGVEAWAEIIIDPNTEENIKHGGFPRDYGPEYHREKRAWFLEATPPAQELFDKIADEQFQAVINIVDW